jgi:DNA-3-methyladenine glycosylase II
MLKNAERRSRGRAARTGAETPSRVLTRRTLAMALQALSRTDRDLARTIRRLGPPPIWGRRPGFPTLVRIILEQQVSLASADAAFRRLRAAISTITPERFLPLDDATLKEIGFSRQKAGYCRHLARLVLDGDLDLRALHGLEDDEARARLTRIKGIGPWSADVYLLMALRRPDVWPAGDLALATAVAEVKGFQARPSVEELESIGERWRPWRAVAARVFWHHYLSGPRSRRRFYSWTRRPLVP